MKIVCDDWFGLKGLQYKALNTFSAMVRCTCDKCLAIIALQTEFGVIFKQKFPKHCLVWR